MNTTHISLIERLRQPGEQEAWARFVELYTPLVYYWARRVGLQPEDAADLVQDVFLVLVKKLPEFSYDRSKSFRGWLRTITLNKWREKQRRKKPPTIELEEVSVHDLDELNSAARQWDAEFREHQAARSLQLMKTDFQPTTWKACWEHVACSRPAAEVAAELGISVGAVHAAKFRVLARLRQELQGLLD
jgi:RNA polymerase sigma-70 factor (ECF subfamily)